MRNEELSTISLVWPSVSVGHSWKSTRSVRRSMFSLASWAEAPEATIQALRPKLFGGGATAVPAARGMKATREGSCGTDRLAIMPSRWG